MFWNIHGVPCSTFSPEILPFSYATCANHSKTYTGHHPGAIPDIATQQLSPAPPLQERASSKAMLKSAWKYQVRSPSKAVQPNFEMKQTGRNLLAQLCQGEQMTQMVQENERMTQNDARMVAS